MKNAQGVSHTARITPRRALDSVASRPTPVGRVWPDGCFGFAIKDGGSREVLRTEEWHNEVFSYYRQYPERYVGNGREILDNTIGLANVHNSHKRPSPPRGSKGMTRYGTRMVSSACRILQNRHGKGKLAFITLTPPNLDWTDWEAWAREWSAALRVFQQWLRRELSRLGLSPALVCVTELQSKRSLECNGVPAYHLHLLCQSALRDYCGLLSPLKIRLAWKRAWENRLSGEYDWNKCEEVRYVRKDAGAYLSKYLTKGGDIAASMAAAGWAFPHTYWGMTSDMREAVKREMLTSEGAMMMVEYLVYSARLGSEWVKPLMATWGDIEIDVGDGHMMRVGSWGRFTARGLAYVRKGVGKSPRAW